MLINNKHLFIPDVQAEPDIPLDHLRALGNYILDQRPDVIICAGDFADFPSLSKFNKPIEVEGKRLINDLHAAHHAMEVLMEPMMKYNERRYRNKKKQYSPRLVMLMGNHEHRVTRYVEDHPLLEGILDHSDPVGYTDFGWELVPFEHIINIDGIRYSHYFRNPQSLKRGILGGTIDNKLNKLGWSFTMGHQQTLQYGVQHLSDGTVRQGLVAGAFYMHDMDYMGPQGNPHWRGVVVKHEVHDGQYDPMFVSINYLLEKWL